MTKWEYDLFFEKYDERSRMWRSSGGEAWGDLQLRDLNRMGRDGWELISCSPTVSGDHEDVSTDFLFVFKRPIKPKEVPPPVSEANAEFELWFEALWKRYPRKTKKAAARKRSKKFFATKTKREDFERALNNYLKHIEKQGTEAQYVKHFTTLCSDYEDYLETSDVLHDKRQVDLEEWLND